MAEAKTTQALSEAQIEIMNLVWERGEVTVADVWKDISSRRPVARNTVQTLMTRLEDRGWLAHREEGGTFVYTAAEDRSRTLKGMVSRLVDTAFQGSAEGLVLALLDGRGVSKDEAGRIRAMIEKAEKGRR
jgi:BlaI family transcriptional regulator, penicillinase repressor